MMSYYGYLNLEKLRFAELQSPLDLHIMEGQKELINKVLVPGKIVIIRLINQKELILSLVLTTFDKYVVICNKTEHQKIYESTGNYSKALEESTYKIDTLLIDSVSTIIQPKEADLLKSYKKFSKEFKEMIKERNDYIKETLAKKHFPSFISKREVPDDIVSNRNELAIQNLESDPQNIKRYECAIYHLITVMYRLKNTKTSEAQLFYKYLDGIYSNSISELDFVDYGFLDAEILNAFTFAKLILEKHLLNAFLNGNKYFSLLLELYKVYKKNDFIFLDETSKFVKFFALISKKQEFTTDEKKQIQDFIKDKVDLYYIQLFD